MVPGMVKKLGAMKYVYSMEGLVLIALAYAPGLHWNALWQVALAMMVCVTAFRLPYGLWRAWRDFQLPGLLLAKALARCGGIMLLLLGIALGLRATTGNLAPLAQVAINGSLYAALAVPIVYLLGLPPEPKLKVRELLDRMLTKCRLRPGVSGPKRPDKVEHTHLQ